MNLPHNVTELHELLEANPDLIDRFERQEREKPQDHIIRVKNLVSGEEFFTDASGFRYNDKNTTPTYSKRYAELIAHDINTLNTGRFTARAELA